MRFIMQVIAKGLSLLLFTGLVISASFAQVPTNNDQLNTSAESSSTATDAQPGAAAINATPDPNTPVKDDLAIHEIGKTSYLPSSLNLGAFHVGPIRMLSAEVEELYHTISPQDGASVGNFPTSVSATLLNSQLAYQQNFHNQRLAIQYQPQIAIVNGQLENDWSNQNANFTTNFALSPHMKLSVQEQFSYVGKQSLLSSYLSADSVSSETVQNQFLDGNVNTLWNDVRATISDDLSATTRVSFSPYFDYAKTDGSFYQQASNGNLNNLSNRIYGFSVAVGHSLSRTKTVGAYYSWQMIQAIPTDSTTGTTYHSMGLSYSQEVTRSLSISGQLGATSSAFPAGRYWTASGSLGVSEHIRSSWLSLAYSRGETFQGYITNNSFGDRVDVSYHVPIGRRIGTGYSVGYFRGNDLIGSKVVGKYATADFGYRLFRRVHWVANYAYKVQSGGDPQLFAGSRSIFSTGLRWDWDGGVTMAR